MTRPVLGITPARVGYRELKQAMEDDVGQHTNGPGQIRAALRDAKRQESPESGVGDEPTKNQQISETDVRDAPMIPQVRADPKQ